MQTELKQELNLIKPRLEKSRSVFDPEKLGLELADLEEKMQNPEIWKDSAKVSKIGQEIKEKKRF